MTEDALIGTTVGRYRLDRVLGAGGMSKVYLGVQPEIGSRVAVKVLSDQCAENPELLERFFAEARAVNLIRHEHIASVLDLARLPDGRPYIVMEFVEGSTLGDLVRQGPAPIGGVVRAMLEVLSALGAAHAIGIVHRDLKPDNILITGEGHAKVLDFGIAKLAPGLGDLRSPRTRTGALLGTPAYMAPEQITGAGNSDARTDIYAAGIVLFEAVTGRVPFTGAQLFELMRAHLEQAPPLARTLRPDLPEAIEQVIAIALAKDPAHRFASTEAMAIALEQASAALPPEQWRSLSTRRVGRSSIQPAFPTPTPSHMPPASPTVVTSRKGLWIGILVAAVAIAVAVIAVVTRSGERAAVSVAPGSAVVVAVDAAVVVAAVEPDAMPVPPHAPKPPPPTTPPTPTPTPPPPTGVTIEGNVKLTQTGIRSLDVPADYNPRQFDPIAYLPKAEALAKRLLPDAGFTEFEMYEDVWPNGRVDLTVNKDHTSYFEFRSPAHSVRPPDVPRNVEVDLYCRVVVEVTPKGASAAVLTGLCNTKLRAPPRCTLAHIWELAKAEGVATDNVVATIGFLHDGMWFFDLDGVRSYPDCR